VRTPSLQRIDKIEVSSPSPLETLDHSVFRVFFIDNGQTRSYLKVRHLQPGKPFGAEAKTMPTAKMTVKGQTVIPKPVRDHLSLKPGDNLDFTIQDNGDVLIRPAVQDVRELKGILRRPGRTPVSVEAMNQAVRTKKGRSSG